MENRLSIETAARALDIHDLHPAIVMADSVEELRDLVAEMREERQREREEFRRFMDAGWHVLKTFGDIAMEVLDESSHREFMAREIRKAERESTRLRLPLWFWRPEDGLELKVQLYRRAAFLLHELHCGLDDCWDLLLEYITDYARTEVPVEDAQLERVIAYAQRRGRDASTSES